MNLNLDPVGIIEATDFEVLTLWQKYSPRSESAKSKDIVSWDEISQGRMFPVPGENRGPETWVSARYAKINGAVVMFWYASGTHINHNDIERFFSNTYPGIPRTDAMNAGNLLLRVKDDGYYESLIKTNPLYYFHTVAPNEPFPFETDYYITQSAKGTLALERFDKGSSISIEQRVMVQLKPVL